MHILNEKPDASAGQIAVWLTGANKLNKIVIVRARAVCSV
jgi:hypothetical protein